MKPLTAIEKKAKYAAAALRAALLSESRLREIMSKRVVSLPLGV
jgi:diacylglycerol kinase